MASQVSLLDFNVNFLKLKWLWLAVFLISDSVLCSVGHFPVFSKTIGSEALEYCLFKTIAVLNYCYVWMISWLRNFALNFALSCQNSTVKEHVDEYECSFQESR